MLWGRASWQQRWHAWADSDTLLPHKSSVTGPRREALVLSSRGFPAGSRRCVLGKCRLARSCSSPWCQALPQWAQPAVLHSIGK